MPQALLDYLAPKKILLLGFGREGRSTSVSYTHLTLPTIA